MVQKKRMWSSPFSPPRPPFLKSPFLPSLHVWGIQRVVLSLLADSSPPLPLALVPCSGVPECRLLVLLAAAAALICKIRLASRPTADTSSYSILSYR